MSLRAGTIIDDRFEIIASIGAGGTGAVYKAYQKDLQRIVALKFLHATLETDLLAGERLRREALVLSQLKHESIISFYGFGIWRDQAYLVLEYVEGKTLSDLIADHNALSLETNLTIVAQICSALSHAHKVGVIHRDLKPQNVMMLNNGNGSYRVKLIDFGLARLLPEFDSQAQRLTQTGMTIGTALYMSPEQCLGGKVDLRADIYSLGAVLYQSFSGLPPFLCSEQESVMIAQLRDTPAPLEEVDPSVEPFKEELQKLLYKALAKLPEDRYQCPDDLAADMKIVASGKRLLLTSKFRTPGIALGYLTRSAGNRRMLPVLATLFLVVVVGCILFVRVTAPVSSKKSANAQFLAYRVWASSCDVTDKQLEIIQRIDSVLRAELAEKTLSDVQLKEIRDILYDVDSKADKDWKNWSLAQKLSFRNTWDELLKVYQRDAYKFHPLLVEVLAKATLLDSKLPDSESQVDLYKDMACRYGARLPAGNGTSFDLVTVNLVNRYLALGRLEPACKCFMALDVLHPPSENDKERLESVARYLKLSEQATGQLRVQLLLSATKYLRKLQKPGAGDQKTICDTFMLLARDALENDRPVEPYEKALREHFPRTGINRFPLAIALASFDIGKSSKSLHPDESTRDGRELLDWCLQSLKNRQVTNETERKQLFNDYLSLKRAAHVAGYAELKHETSRCIVSVFRQMSTHSNEEIIEAVTASCDLANMEFPGRASQERLKEAISLSRTIQSLTQSEELGALQAYMALSSTCSSNMPDRMKIASWLDKCTRILHNIEARSKEERYRVMLSNLQWQVACCARSCADKDMAERLMLRSIEVLQKDPTPPSVVLADRYTDLAGLAEISGDTRLVNEYLGQAEKWLKSISPGDYFVASRVFGNAGLLYNAIGQFDKGTRIWNQGATYLMQGIPKRDHELRMLTQACCQLAEFSRERDDPTIAKKLWTRAQACSAQLKGVRDTDTLIMAQIETAFSDVCAEEGSLIACLDHCRRAVAHLKKMKFVVNDVAFGATRLCLRLSDTMWLIPNSPERQSLLERARTPGAIASYQQAEIDRIIGLTLLHRNFSVRANCMRPVSAADHTAGERAVLTGWALAGPGAELIKAPKGREMIVLFADPFRDIREASPRAVEFQDLLQSIMSLETCEGQSMEQHWRAIRAFEIWASLSMYNRTDLRKLEQVETIARQNVPKRGNYRRSFILGLDELSCAARLAGAIEYSDKLRAECDDYCKQHRANDCIYRMRANLLLSRMLADQDLRKSQEIVNWYRARVCALFGMIRKPTIVDVAMRAKCELDLGNKEKSVSLMYQVLNAPEFQEQKQFVSALLLDYYNVFSKVKSPAAVEFGLRLNRAGIGAGKPQ